MGSALVLIDIQKDYFPGGRMVLDGAEAAAGHAGQLLQRFRELDLPRIHIQHIATRPGATFFLPGTAGIEFHESVLPLVGETVCQKHSPNAFRETSLLEWLRSQGAGQV